MWQEIMTGLPWPAGVLLLAAGWLANAMLKPFQERLSVARLDEQHKQGWARAAALETMLEETREARDRGLIREAAAVRVIDVLLVLVEDLRAAFAADPAVVERIQRLSARAHDILAETRRGRATPSREEQA